MEITPRIRFVEGSFDTQRVEMLCIPDDNHGRVDLCISDPDCGWNIPIGRIKLCPKCGLDYDTCETCGKVGCFDCEGWTRTSDDCVLCPECAAAIKEEYNTNTDNGTKICETCSHFAPDEDDEEYGSCRNNRGGVHQSEWCKEWNKHQEKQQNNETN